MVTSISVRDPHVANWVILSDHIDNALKNAFGWDKVHYYYTDGYGEEMKEIWLGEVTTLELMHHIMNSRAVIVSPFATSASRLSDVVYREDIYEEVEEIVWGSLGLKPKELVMVKIPKTGFYSIETVDDDDEELARRDQFYKILDERENNHWLGDIDYQRVVCADELWAHLWEIIQREVGFREKRNRRDIYEEFLSAWNGDFLSYVTKVRDEMNGICDY